MKTPFAKIAPKRIFIRADSRKTARRLCEEHGFLFLRIEKEAIREIIDTHLPVIVRKIIKSGTLSLSTTVSRSLGRISISHCNLSSACSVLEFLPGALGKVVLAGALTQVLDQHYLNEIDRAIRRRVGDRGEAPKQPSLL